MSANRETPDQSSEQEAAARRPLYRVTRAQLSAATTQTPGMTRVQAIAGQTVGSADLWMGQTHVGPATSSADHHHGKSETGIYVVSGTPVFVFFDGTDEVRLETEPGDYIYVPPWVPHREENPDPGTEAVVVIARTTQEAIVVNLPGLRPVATARQPSPKLSPGTADWHRY
jgi:uncharacterized RmlC-like cupin family protein